tara:strand:- start:330 stop:527 length:198 start_codon:yes stop_codon:yes gene_type:complete
MLEKIKKIFKKKPKAKAKPKKVEEVLVLAEDKTFENEVEKPKFKEQIDQTVSGTVSQTRSETKLG